jgi:hypothetical protein
VSNAEAGNKLAEHFKPNLQEKDPGLFFGKNPSNLPVRLTRLSEM